MITRPDGRIVVVCGSFGSGKTAWTRAQLKDHARVLAWDPHGQYHDAAKPIRSRAALATAANTPGNCRLAYTPPLGNPWPPEFEFWCKVAVPWMQLGAGVLVAEELADVTRPGKAPEAWGAVLRFTRKMGCTVYAITPRPSETDKTMLGGAALLHCHRIEPIDAEYMAKRVGVPGEVLATLPPLHFIERAQGGGLTAGKIAFRAGKVVNFPSRAYVSPSADPLAR